MPKKNNPGCGCCGSCDCPVNCAESLDVYEPSGITVVISGVPDVVFASQLVSIFQAVYGITEGLAAINKTYHLERSTGCSWRHIETFDCSFQPRRLYSRYGSPPAIANCPDPDFPQGPLPAIIETTFELRITVTYNAAAKGFTTVAVTVLVGSDDGFGFTATEVMYCEGATIGQSGAECPSGDFPFLPNGNYATFTIQNQAGNTCPDQEEEVEPPAPDPL